MDDRKGLLILWSCKSMAHFIIRLAGKVWQASHSTINYQMFSIADSCGDREGKCINRIPCDLKEVRARCAISCLVYVVGRPRNTFGKLRKQDTTPGCKMSEKIYRSARKKTIDQNLRYTYRVPNFCPIHHNKCRFPKPISNISNESSLRNLQTTAIRTVEP